MKERISKQLAVLLSLVMILCMFSGSIPVYASTGTEEAAISEEDTKAAEDKAKAEEAAARAKKNQTLNKP